MSEKPTVVPPLPPEEIPQDLKEQVGAIKAFAYIYNFLDKTPVLQVQVELHRSSMAFVHGLYTTMVSTALAHPQSHLSPDLEHLRRVMEVADGSAPNLDEADKKIVAAEKRKRKAKGKLNVVQK